MNKLPDVVPTASRPATRPLIQLSAAALSQVRGGGEDEPDTTHTASKPASKLY